MKSSIPLTLLCALLLNGCTKKQPEVPAEPTQQVVEEASDGLPSETLDQLKADLEWLKAEDRVLVVEDATGTKFVQFKGDTLSVDLPTPRMSPEELARAEAAMKKLGVPKETVKLYGPGGVEAGSFDSYRKDLGGNVPDALDVVEVVFIEVFGLPPDTPLEGNRVM